MSCLSLSELPLSEQIEIELAVAARLEAKFLELFAPLDSSTAVKRCHPLAAPAVAGESILPSVEPVA